MLKLLPTVLIGIVCFTCSQRVAGEVTRLEITRRLAYADGRSFAGVGPYERLLGRAHFAVDPQAPANAQIVDLKLAPRNAEGKVEFWADVELLAPVDLSKANGTLLYDVNNRGRRLAIGRFSDGADEWLMRKGFIVVWSGWLAQVLPGEDRPLLRVPVATDNGQEINSLVREEMVVDAPTNRKTVAHWANQGSYEPTASGLAQATLTRRLNQADPRLTVPRAQWKLEVSWIAADSQTGQLPLVECVLAVGFQPGWIYELIYEAKNPVVQGLGLAGIRDLVSHLKYERIAGSNPLRLADGSSAAKRTIGFGVSQSGRCLKVLLHEGFNADVQGRRVFDGLMPNVAGGGLGYFNHRFASPTRTNGQHENHLYPTDVFPFTYGDATDPFTGQTDGILRRARASNTVPKVMHVDTSAEYWHRSGSLVQTDPLGQRDAEIPAEVRIYAIGGSQHSAGNGQPQPATTGQLPHNPTDYRPLLRGLLMALDAWIRDGSEPPPSVYPRLSNGSLVGWKQGESGWSPIPGVRYPDVIQQPPHADYGREFAALRWVTRHPPHILGNYLVRVPAYGPDNNELGMLLVPAVQVPVATFTGWNLRSSATGADTELLGLAGGYIPFARTKSERERSNDPRLSLSERYGSFDRYLEQYTAAAKKLIAERYLLEEDMPLLLEQARKSRGLFETGE